MEIIEFSNNISQALFTGVLVKWGYKVIMD